MDYAQFVKDKWNEYRKGEKYANVLLLGKTGVGKSSLINTVFGDNIAEVSDTKRGTNDFKLYEGKRFGLTVNLIDSKGYEISDTYDGYKELIEERIINRKAEKDTIHVVWFCISIAGQRIEDIDIMMLNCIYSIEKIKKRLCVVLTKCDEDDEDGSCAKEFKKIIREKVSDNIGIFEVSNDDELNKSLELDKLIDESANMIDDEDIRENFIKSQMVNIEAKREYANKVILGYSTGAAAIGASPIPFSDSALLVPTQLAMITHVTNIYSMQNLKSISKSFVSDIILTQIGKTLAASLLKFIPAIGSWVGGAINAGVASTITFALGQAISEICYSTSKRILNGEDVDINQMFDMDEVKELFKKFFYERNN